MERGVSGAWIVAMALAAWIATPLLQAQTSSSGQKPQNQASGQNHQNGNSQKPAAQDNGNPFPEDENSVPLMPGSNAPEVSAGVNGEAHAAPATDSDPVRSPDDEASGDNGNTSGFSSSQSGLDDALVPPPDENRGKKKKEDDSVLETFPKETPKEDLNVGNYYMSINDWRGALSRFQSALVLVPDNPDVYWGLAECERHMGQYAAARENYMKVMEYDPGSHHAKEAKKALKDPEIANAK